MADDADKARQEVLAMLDMTDDAPGAGGVKLDVTMVDPGTGSPAEGKLAKRQETVLKTDGWDRAKGEELSVRAGNDGESFDKLGPQAWADFHTAAFSSEPELNEHVLDERRKEFVSSLLESDDFKQVREKSVFSRINSEIAAETTAESWAALVEADAKTKAKERDRQSPKGKEQTKADYTRNLGRAVSDVAQKAQAGIDQMDQVARGIGHGGGDPSLLGDLDGVKRIFAAARRNPQLMKVFELAGRYRRVAQSRQRVKFVHGPDEVVGVDLGGDLARVLPVELGRLADDDLELDVMRRFVENTLQSRESRTAENVGKGPVVVVVDESGSMGGDRIANAKAFALAMAWVAKSQKRWCALVGFSHSGAGHSTVVLRPDRWDQDGLVKWLEHFFAGGTDPQVPLHTVPHVLWPQFVEQGMTRGKTDVVMVTDGEIRVPWAMLQNYLDWKRREEVRAVTLTIGSQPGGLAEASDEVHLINALNVADESVGNLLGI